MKAKVEQLIIVSLLEILGIRQHIFVAIIIIIIIVIMIAGCNVGHIALSTRVVMSGSELFQFSPMLEQDVLGNQCRIASRPRVHRVATLLPRQTVAVHTIARARAHNVDTIFSRIRAVIAEPGRTARIECNYKLLLII